MPALQSSRPNLNEDLKEGGRESSFSVRGSRSRSVLVVAQVGFALAVLIVSGLIVRTVIGLERVPLGMNPDGVLTTRVRFDPPNYADEGARLRAIESILERLSSVAGVTAATAVRSLPIAEAEPRRQFTIAGRAAVAGGKRAVGNGGGDASANTDERSGCRSATGAFGRQSDRAVVVGRRASSIARRSGATGPTDRPSAIASR